MRAITAFLARTFADVRVALLAVTLASAYSLAAPAMARGEDLCPLPYETLPVGECPTCNPIQGWEGGWLCPIACCFEMRGEEEWKTCLYGPWQQEPCEGGGS